jgi:hypothetical protein
MKNGEERMQWLAGKRNSKQGVRQSAVLAARRPAKGIFDESETTIGGGNDELQETGNVRVYSLKGSAGTV